MSAPDERQLPPRDERDVLAWEQRYPSPPDPHRIPPPGPHGVPPRDEHCAPPPDQRGDPYGRQQHAQNWDEPRGPVTGSPGTYGAPGPHGVPSHDPNGAYGTPPHGVYGAPPPERRDPRDPRAGTYGAPSRGPHGGPPPDRRDPHGAPPPDRRDPHGGPPLDRRDPHGAPPADRRDPHGASPDWRDPRGGTYGSAYPDERRAAPSPPRWEERPAARRDDPPAAQAGQPGQYRSRAWDGGPQQPPPEPPRQQPPRPEPPRSQPRGDDLPRGQYRSRAWQEHHTPQPAPPSEELPRGQYRSRAWQERHTPPAGYAVQPPQQGHDTAPLRHDAPPPRYEAPPPGPPGLPHGAPGWEERYTPPRHPRQPPSWHAPGASFDFSETVVLPVIRSDWTIQLGRVVQPSEPDEGDDSETVARNSAVMAVGSIVSRVTGFLRTTAIGAALGAAALNDDYSLANMMPNMIYELLLGGLLAGVIIPILVKARKTEPDGGEAYTQRLLTLATVFFGGATLLAVASAPLLTRLFLIGNNGASAADRGLITTLSYLLLPEIFFYGIAAMLSAILNVRGHFAAPMWTPILNNFIVMATAGAFTVVNTSANLKPESLGTAEVLVLGIGTTLGIVVQAIGMWPALRKVKFRWRWRWDFGKLHLRELADMGGWMLVYVILTEIAVLVTLSIAKRAGSHGGYGPAVYLNGFLLFMMAHGIVAVSIMTALMPRMSVAAADGRKKDFAAHLSLGTRLSSVILIPASVAYLVVGRELGITLFQWGNYDAKGAAATGYVIAAAGLSLLPYAVSQLQTFAFYALSDARTPALINVPMVLIRIVLSMILLATLDAKHVVVGLMASSAVAFIVGVALGYWKLRKSVGPLGLTGIFGTLSRLTVAALVGGLVAFPVVRLLGAVLGDGKAGSVIQLLVGTLILGIGYVCTALLLRVDEIKEVASMVGGRLRRG